MADDEGGEVEMGAEDQEMLSAEKAREAKQLDAVTDYHEDGEMDTKKAQAAINALSANDAPSAASQRSAELSSIKVREEDVRLLVDQCEVTEDEATLRLRTANNDVKRALKDLIRV